MTKEHMKGQRKEDDDVAAERRRHAEEMEEIRRQLHDAQRTATVAASAAAEAQRAAQQATLQAIEVQQQAKQLAEQRAAAEADATQAKAREAAKSEVEAARAEQARDQAEKQKQKEEVAKAKAMAVEQAKVIEVERATTAAAPTTPPTLKVPGLASGSTKNVASPIPSAVAERWKQGTPTKSLAALKRLTGVSSAKKTAEAAEAVEAATVKTPVGKKSGLFDGLSLVSQTQAAPDGVSTVAAAAQGEDAVERTEWTEDEEAAYNQHHYWDETTQQYVSYDPSGHSSSWQEHGYHDHQQHGSDANGYSSSDWDASYQQHGYAGGQAEHRSHDAAQQQLQSAGEEYLMEWNVTSAGETTDQDEAPTEDATNAGREEDSADAEDDGWVYQWNCKETGKKFWVNELTGDGKWLDPSPVKKRR